MEIDIISMVLYCQFTDGARCIVPFDVWVPD
jgi:hypothetical protein